MSVYIFWGRDPRDLAALVSWAASPNRFWGSIIFGIVALVALVNVAVAYIHLRAIEYVVTTQRVRIISGIFSKDIQEIELFRVKDTMAHQTFFLRLFGLGTITIVSGDERHPRLVLSGVPRRRSNCARNCGRSHDPCGNVWCSRSRCHVELSNRIIPCAP